MRFMELENEHREAMTQLESKEHQPQDRRTQRVAHGLGDWQDDKVLRRSVSRDSLTGARSRSEERRKSSSGDHNDPNRKKDDR